MAWAIWAQAKLVKTKTVRIPNPQKSARLCCSVKAMTFPPVAPVHDVIAEPTGLKTGHYEDPVKSRSG